MCETENREVKLSRSEAREQAFMLLFSVAASSFAKVKPNV